MGDRRHERATVTQAYRLLLTQARQPIFYQSFCVPDTLDGRFDLLALHLFLLQRRLLSADRSVQRWVQLLMDAFASDMDRSLREMGISDLKVGRKMYEILGAVRGRNTTYEQALNAGRTGADGADHALIVALDNNLYGTVHEVPAVVLTAMAAYVRSCDAALAAVPTATVLEGRFAFPLPHPPAETPGP